MKRVLVLLSTYNGERFLQQQLDSLYNQTVKVDILVRDDGSKDKTLDILKRNASHLNYYLSNNLGQCHSFLSLIKESPNDYDYYMLCDQDDIWLNNKVENAVKKADECDKDQPLLYFSALNLCDENGNVISENVQTLPFSVSKFTLGKSLVKSYGYGCTMLFNSKLKEIYSRLDFPFMDSHDWYMQKIALLFGKVIYDNQASILYRQHSSNVIGYQKKQNIKQKIKKTKYTRSKVANVLIDTYSADLQRETIKRLSIIANSKRFINRFKIMFMPFYKTGNIKIDLYVSFFAFLGWL